MYPSINGDFYGILGIPNVWHNEEEKVNGVFNSKIYCCLFVFFSLNLLISIILTINTPPGSIPEDIEWDMPNSSDSKAKDAFQEAANVILGRPEKSKIISL